METYINFNKKNFLDYIKMILGSKYDRKIAIEFVNRYVDARYYNYLVNEETKSFSKRIVDSLTAKSKKVIRKFPKKEDIVEETLQLFKYFLYFDGVRNERTLNEIIDLLSLRRVKKYKFDKNGEKAFKTQLFQRVKSDVARKKNFLEAFNTDKYELIFRKSSVMPNIYEVDIKHNLKFSDIYKEDAIEHVFSTGLIGEDRLNIEYSLIAIHILKDTVKGNFSKKYVINYAESLLKKKRKNNQILNIVNNQAVQEKLILKVSYKEFTKSRFDIYDLMKKGFKFAITIEPENNIENVNLNMFKYILVTKEHPKIERYLKQFKNVIII